MKVCSICYGRLQSGDVGAESDELLRTLAERVWLKCIYGTGGFFRSLNVDDVEAIFRASF